jgi:hypothetical protein
LSRSIQSSDERQPTVVFYDVELDDAGLNPYQFRVYNRIARRSGGGDHNCTESLAKMASDCQMSRPTLIRAIAELIRRRMIRRISRLGDTSYYALTDKSKWIPGKPQSHPDLVNERATPGKPESHPWPTTEPPLVNERADMKKTIKNTIKEKEKDPPATQSTNPLSHPLGIALLTSAGFSEFQRESLSPMNYSKLQAAVTRLSKASISDQHIIQARRDWWGKSNPTFDQLADLALQAAANIKSNPKPPTHRPYVVEDWQRNFSRE